MNGDACLKYRPDIVYACPESNLVIHVEIDEHEHKYSNGNYKCDERRMSELAEETKNQLVVFIRYNPHNYKVPIGESFVIANDRQQLLLSVLNSIIKNHELLRDKHPQHVFYICYSEDN